jgi:hypothetical protein
VDYRSRSGSSALVVSAEFVHGELVFYFARDIEACTGYLHQIAYDLLDTTQFSYLLTLSPVLADRKSTVSWLHRAHVKP